MDEPQVIDGAAFTDARQRAGYRNREGIAAAADVSLSTVNRVESGKKVDFALLEQLAVTIGRHPADFWIGVTGRMPERTQAPAPSPEPSAPTSTQASDAALLLEELPGIRTMLEALTIDVTVIRDILDPEKEHAPA